jgi:hypothetical protein
VSLLAASKQTFKLVRKLLAWNLQQVQALRVLMLD